jgi:GTPase SAR1 family protein
MPNAEVKMFYRGARVCIICYGINSRVDFEAVESHLDALVKQSSEALPMIYIVGTKSDLDEEGERVIPFKEGQHMTSKLA